VRQDDKQSTAVFRFKGTNVVSAPTTAPIVLVVNGVTRGDWQQTSLFALSLAAGLMPEMRPQQK
jgi:hypothetical protein